jgi:endonuclease-3
MNSVKRQAIFKKLRASNPNPTTELNYTSTFELLIAVMLSAQATDKSVNLATDKLFQLANTPQTILDLGVTQLKTYIQTIGLFNTKAQNVIQTCRLLLEKHKGIVPHTRTELEALPGVGRKTANVVLNTAFGEDTIAVDTHVFRVSNRTKLAIGRTPLEVENQLIQKISKPFLKNAHHWLISHGRYICTARKPKCPLCPIAHLCEYEEKTE